MPGQTRSLIFFCSYCLCQNFVAKITGMSTARAEIAHHNGKSNGNSKPMQLIAVQASSQSEKLCASCQSMFDGGNVHDHSKQRMLIVAVVLVVFAAWAMLRDSQVCWFVAARCVARADSVMLMLCSHQQKTSKLLCAVWRLCFSFIAV